LISTAIIWTDSKSYHILLAFISIEHLISIGFTKMPVEFVFSIESFVR